MSEILKQEPLGANKDAVPELTLEEHNRAQIDLMECMGVGKDSKSRIRWIDENSGPFNRLEKDHNARRFIREGNIEEVKRLLEALKKEKVELAA